LANTYSGKRSPQESNRKRTETRNSGDLPMVLVGPAPESEGETAAARCLPTPRVSGPRLSVAADHARVTTQHGRQPTSARHRAHQSPRHTTVARRADPVLRVGRQWPAAPCTRGPWGASPTRPRYSRDHERKRPSGAAHAQPAIAPYAHTDGGRKIHAPHQATTPPLRRQAAAPL
jgi:hypothetical protein